MAHMYLDICLSDIPRERIKTAANGKKYLKAIIRPRKETDRDGYDHYIAAFIPKEERMQGDSPAFIGRAQEKHYDDQQPAQQASRNTNTSRSSSGQQSPRQSESSDTDDLPF